MSDIFNESQNVDPSYLFDKSKVKVAYVHKDNLQYPVLHPTHEGEEDWYEVEYDYTFDYNDKIYNLDTKEWDDNTDYSSIAKVYVDELVESNIIYLDAEWQVDAAKSEVNINSEITTAGYAELGDDYLVDWILADNTVRETTIGELKGLLVAKANRRTAVYKAYTTWRSGDKKSAFVYEG
jgi:hypothetical protein